MTETATYACSICNEPSLDICVNCTKDACSNHRCARCKECSDCCECEVPLTVEESHTADSGMAVAAALPVEPGGAIAASETADFPISPEASEEPDLNVPSATALEQVAEGEREPGEQAQDPAGVTPSSDRKEGGEFDVP